MTKHAHLRRGRMTLIGGMVLASTMLLGLGAEEEKTLRVVSTLDLQKYAGTWYEIARLPNEFQRDCASDVTATYTPRQDETLEVVNRCRQYDGELEEATGIARRVKGEPSSVLEVRFAPAVLSIFPGVWGDYRVLALSPDYRWSLVGTPDREYLWILSRQPSLDDNTFRRIVARAAEQGFDVRRLTRTPHSASASVAATTGASRSDE